MIVLEVVRTPSLGSRPRQFSPPQPPRLVPRSRLKNSFTANAEEIYYSFYHNEELENKLTRASLLGLAKSIYYVKYRTLYALGIIIPHTQGFFGVGKSCMGYYYVLNNIMSYTLHTCNVLYLQYPATNTHTILTNTRLNKARYSYTQLYRAIHRYTEIYRGIHSYTELCTSIQDYTQLDRAKHSYPRLYTAIQSYTQLYNTIQGYIQL